MFTRLKKVKENTDKHRIFF